MFLDQHRIFVGSDADSELPTAPEASLMSKLASQALSLKSDISGSREVTAAAKFSEEERAALLANKKATVWEVPHRSVATQVLPGHTMHFVSTMFANYSLYKT